jgi:MFS family permease
VLLPSLLSLVGQYAHWATTFGFMPILARQLGGDDVALSLLVSMSVAVYTVGNLAATAVGPRMGPRRLLYACFALLSAGIAGAAAAPSLWALFGAQAAIGLAMGVSYPVLMGMSIQRVADGERTTAMGLHQAVYAVGMFAGPWLSGLLADYVGIRSMFGCTALLCLVLGLVGTRWLGEGKR